LYDTHTFSQEFYKSPEKIVSILAFFPIYSTIPINSATPYFGNYDISLIKLKVSYPYLKKSIT